MLEALVMTPDRSGQTVTTGGAGIRETFEKLGLKVSVYHSFDIAVEYLSVRQVDVVFIDCSMLPTSRPDLIQKLSQAVKTKKCTLIFLATPEERGRMRGSLPFHDAEVVIKPFSTEAVSKALVKLRPGEFRPYRKAN